MALSENLKYWQGLKNYTTAQLAEKANIPPDTINKIRANITRNPSMDTLQKLATALDCSIDDLVDAAPVHADDVRDLLPKKIPTDPEELASIICLSLRNQRIANDRTVTELRKDRNYWRRMALICFIAIIPLAIANVVLMAVLYWDIATPEHGKITMDALRALASLQ